MNRVLNVGSDKVCAESERLIIHAAEPMDVPIREFCKIPVYYLGQKYYVLSKRTGERPYAAVYVLCPWPTGLLESSTRHLIYDEAYVAERDKIASVRRRNERFHLLLLPAYPLLGLCWSRCKNQMFQEWGFEPGSITKASIFLIFNLLIVEGIFVGWFGSGLLGAPPLDYALLLLLGIDTILRYEQTLKLDVERHWGFCEWVWSR